MLPFGCIIHSELLPYGSAESYVAFARYRLLKGMDIMKTAKKLLSILIMVAMITTTFGIITAPEVSAASGLPKVSSLKASAKQTSVTLSWTKLSKKQLKKVSGISIYRNGKLITNISKKSKSYANTGLKAGTSYSYTVKTYKKTKKKEWFNKKTQKWQKKKPAKKWRGKSRKIKKYSAGVKVNITTVASGSTQYTSGNKKQQTINCLGNRTLDIGQKFNLSASASSGLPLTYTSSNPSIASVDNAGIVTANGSGTATIYIRQAGNSEYDSTERNVIIKVNSANITIKFNGNGATSGSMANQTLINGKGTLNSNAFVREGYKFKGWDTNANTTTPRWLNNGTFTQISDTSVTVTLYAIWEKDATSTVVTKPLTFTYQTQNSSGENVIDVNSGNVTVNISSMPDGVKSITWSVVKVGMADGTNTVTLVPSNNGKSLSIKANNALSNRGTLGQFKLKAVFEMQDGYIYYDKDGNGTPNEVADRTVTSPIITNTVYPMEGNISSATWDYKVFGKQSVESGSIRKLDVFSELPTNSTVNININEWDDTAHGTVLALNVNDITLATPEKDLDVILTRSKVPTSMRLIHAGTFQLSANNKTITFNLTGQNNDMVTYSNHLKSVANSCRSNTKYDTAMNCLAYVLTHYTYNESYRGTFPFDTSGQCNSGNTYYADLLRYCGIEAYVRNAQEYLANHVVTGAILDNNTRYIIDATPNDYIMQDMNSALYYINGLVAHSSSEWCRGMRVITWDDYYYHYSKFPGLSFYQ